MGRIGTRIGIRYGSSAMASARAGSIPLLGSKITGFWLLDEAANTDNASDTFAGNTLTRTGTPGVAAGKIGGCRTFSGSGQYFTASDATALRFGNKDWMVAGWLLMGAWATEIVSKATNFTTALEMRFRADASGRGVLGVGNGGTSELITASTGAGALGASTWKSFVLRFSQASQKCGISIDGAAFIESSAAASNPGTSSAVFSFGQPMSGNAMAGRLDHIFKADWLPDNTFASWWHNSGSGRSYSETLSYVI